MVYDAYFVNNIITLLQISANILQRIITVLSSTFKKHIVDMLEVEETSKNSLTVEYKVECAAKLRKLLKEEECLKNIHNDSNDAYLERYLYGTEFDVEVAFNRIKMFYSEMLENPRWYSITAPLDKKSLIDRDIRIVIPQFDKEGRPIYIVKLGKTDVRSMEFLDVVAVDDIWIESILSSNPFISEKGLSVILDVANIPLSMMKWVTPQHIKLGLKKLQSLPFKDFRFHVVNRSFLIHALIKIIWPFLPEHIKQMVKFHFDDWDSLHEHIDPDTLPLEYGGTNIVNYNDIYSKLYDRNEEISTCFKLHRTINI